MGQTVGWVDGTPAGRWSRRGLVPVATGSAYDSAAVVWPTQRPSVVVLLQPSCLGAALAGRGCGGWAG